MSLAFGDGYGSRVAFGDGSVAAGLSVASARVARSRLAPEYPIGMKRRRIMVTSTAYDRTLSSPRR